LRERRFDAVLACDVLEHLRRPEGVLCSLREQIKPGGRLIVSIPNIAYAGVLAALRNGNFNYADKGQLDRTHIHFFTRKSFETMLLASGWIPVALEAHRVEISDSEFSGEWGLLANTVRESLSADWPDFNVYQWMVEAVPANEAGWQHVSQMALQAAKAEMDVFKAELMTLNDVHQREHESLLEHQKAFGEAKVIIDDLRRQLANAEIERKVVLERALSADEGASERGWLKKLLPFLRSKPAGGAGE
jgi:SAM-dependent methyltransferase